MHEGRQKVIFDASDIKSGVYFYRMNAEKLGVSGDNILGSRFDEVKK